MNSQIKSRTLTWMLCGAAIFSAFATSGCQSNIGGMTLPSAYFLDDDVQYFKKGPEFKLSREAAALKESRAEAMTRKR